jgi:hypothetical protein
VLYTTPERLLRRDLARLEFEHWRTFIALLDEDQAAGHGALFVSQRTRSAVLGAATTLPTFQRRGCQTASIVRRAADAFAAGCDLLAVETMPGSQSERNLQRLGFVLAYRRAIWGR